MLSLKERELIRVLQDELPLCSRPFRAIGSRLGWSEQEVLEMIRSLKERGVIRRVTGVIGHRTLGISANALILWHVPEDQLAEIGSRLASCPEVTHCYSRRVPSGWPYRLFTMIHARNREQCMEKIRRVAARVNLSDYLVLFSTRELKKRTLRYRL